MTLLALASLAFVNEPPRRDSTVPDRPVFTRRMSTLPPMVVTAPDHSQSMQSSNVRPR